jgi:2-polyprenyl-6-hydroxyphenyl methylase/3-demethylubiquinone-9 3-methyltransferase
MNHVVPTADWPQAWHTAYAFDREEVYGQIRNRGYAYAYAERQQQTLQMVRRSVPAGARLLDIAAAQGNFTLALAEEGYDVTWNDLRGDLVDYVKLKHQQGQVSYAPGNAFELQFAQPFDAVLITEVIEHVAHPDQFLAKVAALVKPGGAIIMTTPNGAYLRNTLPRFSDCPDPSVYESGQFKPDADGHIFLLYPDEINRFAASCGLQIEACSYFVNPLTNGHLKTAALLALLPRAWVQMIERLTQQLPVSWQQKLLIQVGVVFRKPLSAAT